MKTLALSLLLFLSIAAKSQCAVQNAKNKSQYLLAFYAEKKDRKALMTVKDTAGNIVYASRVKVLQGLNSATFYSNKFPTGIYIVTISDVFTTQIANTKEY
jgi:hypothetical protein